MNDTSDWGNAGLTWKRHGEQVAAQLWPAGCLYVVATPIGNLADMSLRAWQALRQCDVIAAEDTRTTRALLDAWGIATPLLAAHRHNEQQAAEAIVQRLSEGQRVALVSDAGARAVSDPGARVVRSVQAAGHRVVPLPGPSAVIAALMASGATSDEEPGFAFAGFAPTKPGARRKWLAHWLAGPVPVVLFEAPHRLRAMLADLVQVAGDERRLTLARELTKRFEEIRTLPAAEMLPWLLADPHREQGEFVLVVHAPARREDIAGEALSADQARLMEALLAELSVRDAVRVGVRATGLSRDVLYAWALARRDSGDEAAGEDGPSGG
jgi:16S rRNA (cytidine1402-2'-O)-methyltransferase